MFKKIATLILFALLMGGCGGPATPRNEDVAPVPTVAPTEAVASPTGERMPSPTASPLPAVEETAVSAPTEYPAEDVLTFDISGGNIGFCDTLRLGGRGDYLLQSCQAEAPIQGNLSETDLISLRMWYDNLAGFERQTGGGDSPEATLTFVGRGETQPDETQQQIIYDWVNGLLLRLRPQAVAPPPTPTLSPAGLCPEISRPAVLIADYENPSSLLLVDPNSGAECDVRFDQPPFGRVATANGNIYYPRFDPAAQSVTIWRLGRDGQQTPLDFTTVSMEQFGPLNFVISEDGRRIAWARAAVDFEVEPPLYRNDLWVANIDGSNKIALIEQAENTESRYVEPVRFVDDTLYYAMQPDGLGGMIFSYSGRYDTIYSLTLDGGPPRLIYACPEEEAICLGDVAPDGSALAYAAQGLIQIIAPDGRSINSLTPPATDYIGRAVFGPEGRLAFVSASLSEGSEEELPRPAPGYISWLAPPYTGQPETLLSGDGIAAVWEWLDGSRLLYGTMDEMGNIGASLVTLEGQSRQLSPNYAVAVLR